MLLIRKEQMEGFEKAALKQYQKGLISHVREHFPIHAEYLGDEGVMGVIEHGCTRAEEYGFETERDLCLYTDLSIMLGVGFDTDPQLPWANAILCDETHMDPWDRMDMLWEKAMKYMEGVLGPDDVFPVKAYQLADKHLRFNSPGLTTETIEDTIVADMKAIWPEKAEYLGLQLSSALFRKSFDEAINYDVTHYEGQAEFTILSFLLGYHFFIDPLYPWTQEILRDLRIQSGQERMVRLRRAFQERFEFALAQKVYKET